MTYLAIASVIRSLIGTNVEYSIESDVKTGSIATILTKPVSYPLYRSFKGFGVAIAGILMGCIPILALSFIFLNISLPVNLPMFIVSLALGFLVNYMMVLLIGMWSFWSGGSVWGIKSSKEIVSDIMSGAIIPISMFPASIANIANFLPFQTVFSVPISIYLGKITGINILYSLVQQSVWIVVLGLVCYLVWKRAESKVVVHGG
jgi:ABC-2 type transport system permease protein